MRLDPHRLIARFCHSAYLDELLGDLEELRMRRTRTHGPRYAQFRYCLDVTSALVFQSRVRRWTASEWGIVAAVTVMSLLALGGARYGGPPGPYTITATDAAGVFTLDMFRGIVVAATVDGRSLPPERIVQRGRFLTLQAADASGNLEIEITPDGGIRWDGREPAPTAEHQDPPIALDWARDYFAEVDSVSAADGGHLWGVPLSGPILFVERSSRSVVANVPDSAGLLSERDGVWVGTLPLDVGIANTAVSWAGRRWAMVMWPVSSQGYARRKLLLHESFHRIQPQLGLEMGNPSNAHLASQDGRVLARLEWRALAEALIRSGNARLQAMEDALAFRTRRHELFAGANKDERALELNEGIAEYTGLRLSGLPTAARAVTAARELMRRESTKNFTRSFAYASGPAYGILLDDVHPSWRDSLSSAGGLDDLLRAALRLSPTDDAGVDVATRAARYDGTRVMVEEARAAERGAAEQALLRAAFLEGRPTLTLPVGDGFGFSFDPNHVVPLEGHGTVYTTAEVRDDWGRLIVESGGVLMKRTDRLITGVVVPVAPGTDAPPVAGDGWRLELAEGWTVQPGERGGDWVVVPTR